MNYTAPEPADDPNRVRVKVAFGNFRVGDTFCPPAGSVPTLVQRGLVERVKGEPPKLDRMMGAGGKRGGRYATR